MSSTPSSLTFYEIRDAVACQAKNDLRSSPPCIHPHWVLSILSRAPSFVFVTGEECAVSPSTGASGPGEYQCQDFSTQHLNAHWAHTGTNVMLFLLLDVAHLSPPCNEVSQSLITGWIYNIMCHIFSLCNFSASSARSLSTLPAESCTELRLQAELRRHVAFTCSTPSLFLDLLHLNGSAALRPRSIMELNRI